jgi:hypothetical protein
MGISERSTRRHEDTVQKERESSEIGQCAQASFAVVDDPSTQSSNRSCAHVLVTKEDSRYLARMLLDGVWQEKWKTRLDIHGTRLAIVNV